MERKLYDNIILKDGREAIIVDFLGPNTYIVDVGNSPADWDTILIKEVDISPEQSTQ